MRSICIILFLFIVLAPTIVAQNTTELFDEGVVYFETQQYDKAIAIFQEILERQPKIPLIYLYLAHSYKYDLQYDKAIETYNSLIEMRPKKYPECYFSLAQLYEMTGNTLEAKRNYVQFVNLAKEPIIDIHFAHKKLQILATVNSIIHNDTIQLIRDTTSPFFQNFGVQMIKKSVVYNGIRELNDTLSHAMFYTTDTSLQTFSNRIFDFSSYSYTDICPTTITDEYWVIRRNNSNLLTKPTVYGFNLKQTNFQSSERKPFHDNSYISIHPFIYAFKDSVCLFFASNAPNGFGGMDIWYCIIDSNNNISAPKNAGKKINSEFDEICPWYYSKDSSLYFSSNRPESIGGFDVFSKNIVLPESDIYQLPQPINSTYNDLYFRYFDTIAYLTSNRIPKKRNNTIYNVNSIFTFKIVHPHSVEPAEKIKPVIKDFKPISVYFDFDKPEKSESLSYANQYFNYIKKQQEYITSFKDSVNQFIAYKAYFQNTQNFYNLNIIQGKQDLDSLIRYLQYVEPYIDTIRISVQAYTGIGGLYEYNTFLAQRRIESVTNYITSQYKKSDANQKDIKFYKLPHAILQSKSKALQPQLFDVDDARNRKVVIKVDFVY